MSAPVAVAVALLIAASLGLLLRRVRVRASLHGNIDEEGAWAASGGAQAGPFALSVAASSHARAWALHVFGKRIAHGRGKPALRGPRLDLSRTLRLLAALAERVRFDVLRIHVRCGARDPSVTGPLAGTLAALGGALAPFATITHEIDWLADDLHASFRGDAELTVAPLSVGLAILRLRASRPTLAAAPSA